MVAERQSRLHSASPVTEAAIITAETIFFSQGLFRWVGSVRLEMAPNIASNRVDMYGTEFIAATNR